MGVELSLLFDPNCFHVKSDGIAFVGEGLGFEKKNEEELLLLLVTFLCCCCCCGVILLLLELGFQVKTSFELEEEENKLLIGEGGGGGFVDDIFEKVKPDPPLLLLVVFELLILLLFGGDVPKAIEAEGGEEARIEGGDELFPLVLVLSVDGRSISIA